jgi:putative SOS response-associated peptidase YedK
VSRSTCGPRIHFAQPASIRHADSISALGVARVGLIDRSKKARERALTERWHGADQEIESCTIITTDANDLMRPIHDRMPVILAPADYDRWLDPAVQKADLLQTLLRPCAEGVLTAIPVSTRVNNPKNDDPMCVESLAG